MLWLLMLSMYLLAIDNILHDFALLYDLNLYSLNFEKVFKLSIRICSRMVNLGLALMTIGFKRILNLLNVNSLDRTSILHINQTL